jgi:orotate phosphoribosyltransferase
MSTERERLLALLKRQSYVEGDFVLASGRTSHYLVDVKRTALDAGGASLIGTCMLAAIRRHWPSAEGIGGRELGAVPLAVSVSLASLADGERHLHSFIARKESKAHGTGRLIEVAADLSEHAKVVVLEDVSTTGGSALAAVEVAREAGYTVLGALTLVDREEGAGERFAAADVELQSVFTANDLVSA